MEVDRIARMGGVGPDQSPAWTAPDVRRRRFAEELAGQEDQTEEEEAKEESEEGSADNPAGNAVAPEDHDELRGTAFDVMA